ncbi:MULTISPECIES: LysR family transcriptional regulator [unclassified Herbaspirillum]|uniref:LysR family transcriptional regulator n=1 Tax=unclassified Herbaspirillum TaxID=2624150 RepID=UPI00115183B3|nr:MULTISPECIES: LysR family transcriptional regulator [unclassified Herbaspirillum]MBB5393337.1 DNA-binding transcriptional LysR family regulator [Herbaspirillum sp. SJZ102]TQK03914.1 DNA-binding transcriptional LysR family regulator [Herbaspirillum sp. SJZ130]TQK08646.1 DNA-binding transcriptional LysR family regulator [Herbaspirillum sp. SJZ106]TWC71917.1 DNA-binding transcriptional LysR family regulator [Herbaspirillum sp. SJZ099]
MNIERLSLDQLRVFAQVADSGSFLAAARKLARAQSAVSYAIATLEEQLGVALFDRSGYRPQLTGPGIALLADARQVLDHVDSLQVRASSYAKGQELEVALAVDVFFPTACLVDLLQRFRDAFPAVTVRLDIEALGAVAERVLDGRAMLGILGTLPTTPPNLLRITLPSVKLVAVVAPHHPLAQVKGRISEKLLLQQTQLVLSDRSELTARQDFSVHSRLTWRMSDLGTKHALLRAGMGWGNMPLHVVQDDIASGRLVSIATIHHPPQGSELPVQCVYKPDYRAGPALSWWLDSLAALNTLEPLKP